MTTRRQFLCFAAGIGSAVGCGSAAVLWQHFEQSRSITGSTAMSVGETHAGLLTSRKGWALGSEVSISVIHPDPQVAADGIDAAFGELELVENVMSLYRPHSQLCRLNRDGAIQNPHPYLCEVLQAAADMSRRTDGAFDITVQPLWELFAAHQKRGNVPPKDAIKLARQSVGWQHVHWSDKKIRLAGERTAITLNGIAQGFATDKALATLRGRGIHQALINAGEIGSLGQKGPGEDWTVGIQHPRCADAFISLTRLAGRCLATSGDYATTFGNDFRAHHIFDPLTGMSPTELSSVTIAAPTAIQADALSTAVFVLGPDRGAALMRATPDTDALLVLKDGRTLATDGFNTTGTALIEGGDA